MGVIEYKTKIYRETLSITSRRRERTEVTPESAGPGVTVR